MTKRRQTIELRHLRYFLAAAEHGSFRKAGVWLSVRESAISRRIRDLEDCLGASLFQRYNGGVRLTLAGNRFLYRARAAMCDIEAGAFDVAAIGRVETGQVRIGTAPDAASAFLVNLLRDYNQRHAGVRLEFVGGDAFEQVAAIQRQDIDVAFVAGNDGWNGCETMPLWTEPVFVVLPEGHHLVDRDDLEWHHLAEECLIVGDRGGYSSMGLGRVCKRFGDIDRSMIFACSAYQHRAHLPLVALGRGVMLIGATTIVSDFPGIVYRPIIGEMLAFCAVWLPGNDNPAFRRLLALARRQSDRSRC